MESPKNILLLTFFHFVFFAGNSSCDRPSDGAQDEQSSGFQLAEAEFAGSATAEQIVASEHTKVSPKA